MEIPEIYEKILIKSSIKDIANLCQVNRLLRSLCNDGRFWIRKFRNNNIPLLQEHTNYGDWMREYRRSLDAIRTSEARLRNIEWTGKLNSIIFTVNHIPPKILETEFGGMKYKQLGRLTTYYMRSKHVYFFSYYYERNPNQRSERIYLEHESALELLFLLSYFNEFIRMEYYEYS